MRRPFVLLLILISLYCWFTDVVNFFFYVVGSKSPNTHTYSNIIGLILFLGMLVGLKVTFFKNFTVTQVKEVFQTHRRKEWLLLFFVSLPLIALGLFRAIFPDQNFDTIHYELYLQEFDYTDNLRHFAPGGTATYIFHLSELFTGLFRHLLGYRLGSAFNIFLLVAIIASAYDFINKFLSVYAPAIKVNTVLPALAAAFVVFGDSTLSVVGSYKTDLIGIPLIIELLYMLVFGGRYSNKVNYAIFFTLASLTTALKLTYFPSVVLLCFIYFLQNYKSLSLKPLLFIPFVILLFPGPCLIYSIMETGSPLFPFYNSIFHSPLYPDVNFRDVRFGPASTSEVFIYQFISLLEPARRNEWQLYSYRLLIGFLACWGIVAFYLLRLKKNKYNKLFRQIAFLSLIAILFDYLWAASTGITRYASLNEVLYALVLALFCIYVREKIASVLLIFVVLIQCFITFYNIYVKQINMSWHNYPALLENKEIRRDNINMILHDYGKVIDPGNVLPTVDAFVLIEPCIPDGLARLASKKAAIYDLTRDRTRDIVDNFEKNVVRVQSQNKNLMVFSYLDCWGSDFFANMNKKGFLATDMYEVYPDFMRPNEPVFLFKIKYLDTSKYIINTTKKFVDIGAAGSPDSVFTFQSDKTAKAFIRESPYALDWPQTIYNLSINDKTYKVDSKAKGGKIFTLDSNNFSVRTDQQRPMLIVIQEIGEKKQ